MHRHSRSRAIGTLASSMVNGVALVVTVEVASMERV